MATHMFVVFTECKPGGEAEFNDWYDNQHNPEVLKMPGFVAVQRFRVLPEPDEADPPSRYLALFEIETTDIAATLAEARRRPLPQTDTTNHDASRMVIVEAMGPRVIAPVAAE